MMIDTLTILGPGRNCESDSTSRNSASFSQRRSLDDHAPRERHDAAEAGQTDLEETEKQRRSADGRLLSPSLAEQPKDQANQRRDDQAGSQRKVEREAFALDSEVAGEPSETKLGEQWPGEARDDEDDAERYQQPRHAAIVPSGPASSAPDNETKGNSGT